MSCSAVLVYRTASDITVISAVTVGPNKAHCMFESHDICLLMVPTPWCLLPGTVSSGSEAAPNAEAKCAQQAVRLLSEYLSGSHRLASSSNSTPCTPLQGISPGHSHPTGVPSEELSSEEQRTSLRPVTKSSVDSHSADSTSATEQRRTDEQQCCVMWGKACDKHLPQVSLRFAASFELQQSLRCLCECVKGTKQLSAWGTQALLRLLI